MTIRKISIRKASGKIKDIDAYIKFRNARLQKSINRLDSNNRFDRVMIADYKNMQNKGIK